MSRKALIVGTMDPMHLGHVELIERALLMFDEVVVGIAINEQKKPMFSVEERVDIAKKCCQGYVNNGGKIKVVSYSGATIDLALKEKCCVLLRGLRSSQDYEYESQIEAANLTISEFQINYDNRVQTVYLNSTLHNKVTSSSMAKQLAQLRRPNAVLRRFLPLTSTEALQDKIDELEFAEVVSYCLRPLAPVRQRYNNLRSLYKTNAHAYHNWTHIRECLREFQEVETYIPYAMEVKLAIFYHDVVYTPGAKDNEKKSAEFLIQECGTSSCKSERAFELVLATDYTKKLDYSISQPISTAELDSIKYLRDIDFAILGQESSRFLEYDRQITLEFNNHFKPAFKIARKRFLKSLLNKSRIYYTDYFYEKYENTARKNITELLHMSY
jgi:pantetheine-phosphate adenylyltransferase